MSFERLSLSLQPEIVATIRKRAADRALSLSDVVTDAVMRAENSFRLESIIESLQKTLEDKQQKTVTSTATDSDSVKLVHIAEIFSVLENLAQDLHVPVDRLKLRAQRDFRLANLKNFS